jgi:sugar/nucleoside kinase (ribokinase family)
MKYVSSDDIDRILADSRQKPHIVPGGSACNTIVGIAKLGGFARFVGKLGKDEFGALFSNDLLQNGVEPLLIETSSPTGRVLSIVTPDAQRSMLTCLGASAEMGPDDLMAAHFDKAAIVLLEGYQLFNKELFAAVVQTAREMGASVALDLASFTVVNETKPFLASIIADYVHILLANEDEALAFTGCKEETRALEALSQQADIAVLKLGKNGSLLSHKGRVIKVEPIQADRVIDTTGAGDLWAAGFLYGLVNGLPIEKCGELGSACGCEVCQVVGAFIPEAGWARIKERIEPKTEIAYVRSDIKH